ncbi:family 43 glycosylhydrolase [bacterium]|nr:family 43 glycosylhydrolase [bacterium]
MTVPISTLVASDAEEKDGLVSFSQNNTETFGGEWLPDGHLIKVTGSPAKLCIGQQSWRDFILEVEVKANPDSQAGVIFRASQVGREIDQYSGYYVGVHAGRDSVMWGAANNRWQPIAQRAVPVTPGTWYTIKLIVFQQQFKVWINQTLITTKRFPIFNGVDNRFKEGVIGLRSLGSGASFRNLRIHEYHPQTKSSTYTNPVQINCADPTVLQHQGLYYAYCTYSKDHPNMTRGIRLYTSSNLVQWHDQGFIIKAEQSWGTSKFWAPDIVQKNGKFYLYYATDTRICVAQADSPSGPFQERSESPILPETVRIDAHVFQDDEKAYFYYVRFNRGNEIWGGELNDDMVSLKQDTLRLMIKPDQEWERHQGAIAEGPVILKHDDIYYLTYSGSHFESPQYAVGYATSDSPLGPWKKYQHNPIMKSTAYAKGTAHHCFTDSPDGTEKFIIYHRHHNLQQTEPRKMAIDRVQFVTQPKGPAILEINGPTGSPQPLASGATLE